MNITITHSQEACELVKALASTDKETRYNAQVAIADIIGPVLEKQNDQAPILCNLFRLQTFSDGSNPTIPLDAYREISDSNYIKLWQSNIAGGVPTNEVFPSTAEFHVALSHIETATEFHKKHIAQGLIDVVARCFEFMGQELLVKEETACANTLIAALADAETNGKKHVMRSSFKGQFTLDDFGALRVFAKRLYTSWINGTPTSVGKKGVTDLFMGPELVNSIFKMSYNAVNTQPAPMEGALKNGLLAPEDIRRQLYAASGDFSLLGIHIHEYNEFGIGQRYNELFAKLAGETEYDGAKFDKAAEQIILGIDSSVDSLYRFSTVSDDGRTIQFQPDDSYTIRSGKIGWYGGKDVGHIVLDDRALSAIIV